MSMALRTAMTTAMMALGRKTTQIPTLTRLD